MIKAFIASETKKPTLIIDFHYTYTMPKLIWTIVKRTNLRKANERVRIKQV